MIKNLTNEALVSTLRDIAKERVTKIIIPGIDYIPVTGKVLDEEDILMGVDSILDAWLTAGRYSEDFERRLARYFDTSFSFLVKLTNLRFNIVIKVLFHHKISIL